MGVSIKDNDRQLMKVAKNALFCSLNEMEYKFKDQSDVSSARL